MAELTSLRRRIRTYRTDLRLTTGDAAERAGISESRWEQIETGSRRPTVGDLLGISWAVGVTFDALRGDSDLQRRLIWTGHVAAPIADAELAPTRDRVIALIELAHQLEEAGYLARHADEAANRPSCGLPRIDQQTQAGADR
jgi:transcriptional regulator with XRE-family HTH domain